MMWILPNINLKLIHFSSLIINIQRLVGISFLSHCDSFRYFSNMIYATMISVSLYDLIWLQIACISACFVYITTVPSRLHVVNVVATKSSSRNSFYSWYLIELTTIWSIMGQGHCNEENSHRKIENWSNVSPRMERRFPHQIPGTVRRKYRGLLP